MLQRRSRPRVEPSYDGPPLYHPPGGSQTRPPQPQIDMILPLAPPPPLPVRRTAIAPVTLALCALLASALVLLASALLLLASALGLHFLVL